jgi:hypothetical protein
MAVVTIDTKAGRRSSHPKKERGTFAAAMCDLYEGPNSSRETIDNTYSRGDVSA